MPGFDVEVNGLAELKAKLEQLARPTAKRMENRALRAGAEVYKAAIEQRTPERHESPSGTALPPGALKRDIRIKTISAPEEESSYVAVGPGAHTAHVMRWLEYGHAQVRNTSVSVGAKGKGRGRLGKGGTSVGFVPAHPIMRPAFETAQQTALDAVVNSLKADLADPPNGGG